MKKLLEDNNTMLRLVLIKLVAIKECEGLVEVCNRLMDKNSYVISSIGDEKDFIERVANKVAQKIIADQEKINEIQSSVSDCLSVAVHQYSDSSNLENPNLNQ